jgi:hypothetical protein
LAPKNQRMQEERELIKTKRNRESIYISKTKKVKDGVLG